MKKSHTTIILLLWIICVVCVVAGSLSAKVAVPEKYFLDKFIHGGAYGLLAMQVFFLTRNRIIIITFLVLIISLGGAVELLQTLVPGRSGTIGDFAADTLGVILGSLLAVKLRTSVIGKWL